MLRLITRLRQRCGECESRSIADCNHMPNRALLTFNPGNPGHWLQRWFIEGTERTEFGLYKPELWMEGATAPIGDAEFFFAKATDNPHLPRGYVEQTLGGMKEWMRRRYLEGLWEFISGNSFFDVDSLRDYELKARDTHPAHERDHRWATSTPTSPTAPAAVPKPESDKLRVERGKGPLHDLEDAGQEARGREERSRPRPLTATCSRSTPPRAGAGTSAGSR